MPVQKNKEISLVKQIYEQIREKILYGELKEGEKMPSTRQLSESLQISRNVITEAYEQLLVEGFVISRKGSGTYVAKGFFAYKNEKQPFTGVSLSMNPRPKEDNSKDIIDFCPGTPALDHFPRKKWARLLYDICLDISSKDFGYMDPEGDWGLRQSLARYLSKTRGVQCSPDRIVITNGAIQALYLIGKLLISPQRNGIMMEEPCHQHIKEMFMLVGAFINPIQVDEYGMKTMDIAGTKDTAFIYATPSHQYPMGGVLPIQRRIELIQATKQMDCYIIEDDYDSEFRFEGMPISSLQRLEPERVIYVGTFSKILSPALRIGYMVLPYQLIASFHKLKYLIDHHSSAINQMALSQFIEQGYLDRHVAKMKKAYQKRQEKLIQCLKACFPDQIKIHGKSAGLHLVAEFAYIEFTPALISKLENAKVLIEPVVADASCENHCSNKLIMGYSNLTEDQIEKGIWIMKNVMEDGQYCC